MAEKGWYTIPNCGGGKAFSCDTDKESVENIWLRDIVTLDGSCNIQRSPGQDHVVLSQGHVRLNVSALFMGALPPRSHNAQPGLCNSQSRLCNIQRMFNQGHVMPRQGRVIFNVFFVGDPLLQSSNARPGKLGQCYGYIL